MLIPLPLPITSASQSVIALHCISLVIGNKVDQHKGHQRRNDHIRQWTMGRGSLQTDSLIQLSNGLLNEKFWKARTTTRPRAYAAYPTGTCMAHAATHRWLQMRTIFKPGRSAALRMKQPISQSPTVYSEGLAVILRWCWRYRIVMWTERQNSEEKYNKKLSIASQISRRGQDFIYHHNLIPLRHSNGQGEEEGEGEKRRRLGTGRAGK